MAMTATIAVPGARSLKDRRKVAVSVRDRLRSRFSVSCHEVHGDGPYHTVKLLITSGAADKFQLERLSDTIRAYVGSMGAPLQHFDVETFALGEEPGWGEWIESEDDV